LKATIGGRTGRSIAAAALLLLSLITGLASATPHTEDISTVTLQYPAKKSESLHEIARKFDLGVNDLVNANPGVDPFVPGYGSIVQIPVSRILPEMPAPAGIVVNLPEFRLYVFPADEPESVLTFPIGIGDLGNDTPVGTYTVTEKIVNPAWHVPESIRKGKPELPKVVPPGPDNPMGSHALRLSAGSVLIHGTDRPWSIGTRSSHGCLRLYPEDIVRLFKLVNLGTRVSIVNQPVKVVVNDEKVFVEVHGSANGSYLEEAVRLLRGKKLLERVDMPRLTRALIEMSGMPVDITR
jgi:L,D-transpeptidase ErfK/SrfK